MEIGAVKDAAPGPYQGVAYSQRSAPATARTTAGISFPGAIRIEIDAVAAVR